MNILFDYKLLGGIEGNTDDICCGGPNKVNLFIYWEYLQFMLQVLQTENVGVYVELFYYPSFVQGLYHLQYKRPAWKGHL